MLGEHKEVQTILVDIKSHVSEVSSDEQTDDEITNMEDEL